MLICKGTELKLYPMLYGRVVVKFAVTPVCAKADDTADRSTVAAAIRPIICLRRESRVGLILISQGCEQSLQYHVWHNCSSADTPDSRWRWSKMQILETRPRFRCQVSGVSSRGVPCCHLTPDTQRGARVAGGGPAGSSGQFVLHLATDDRRGHPAP